LRNSEGDVDRARERDRTLDGSATHGMTRRHRFRLFVVCSFLILVGAAGFAAQSAAARGPTPRSENASAFASALGRARAAGGLARSESGLSAAGSSGAAFVAPATFYARSRAIASAPVAAPPRPDSSIPRPACTAGQGCDSTAEPTIVATETAGAADVAGDKRLGGHLGLAAAGVFAAGSFVAADAMTSRGENENLSPARWFLAAGHFDDTTDVGLSLRGPWAPPKGSPPSPWQPAPCHTTETCAFAPPGSPNDPGHGSHDPSDGPDNGNPDNGAPDDGTHNDGDPSRPPVISTTTTPEPSTVFLLATGLGLIAFVQFRRRRVAIEAR